MIIIITTIGLPAEIVNVILAALLFFPFLLILADTFFRALFLVVVEFFRKSSKLEFRSEMPDLHLLILVVANNEQQIIVRTLDLIQSQIAGDLFATVALLADNCTDDTVELAIQSGVKVFIRSDQDNGKGRALSWFATHFQHELEMYDLVTIIDADTMISKDFCCNLRLAFYSENIQVVQSFVEPVNANGLPLVTLAAFSEILSQSIDDEARSWLGWTSPLRGTGMVFRRDVFLRICPGLQTQVDDIELSLRLVECKIPVVYCSYLKIFDPKSASILGLARQRGRWLSGQRDVWRYWQGKLKVFSGFSEWALLHSLLLKPKTALFAMKIILLGIFYFLDTGFFVFPRLFIFLSLHVDLFYYLAGFRHVIEPRKYLCSFLSAPLFFIMWVGGWSFSFGRRGQWLRSRK